jgi:transposase-like protein
VIAPLVLTLLATQLPPALPVGREGPPARRESVPALVRRCVAAYGGRGALTRAAVARQEGRVTSLLHPGVEGRILRAYGRPGRLRVETSFPKTPPELRVLDGGRGWRNGQEVDGARLAAMMLQAARMDLPALLSAWVDRIEDQGEGEVAGAKVRVLALAPAPGLLVQADVDVATGRVVRSRGSSLDPKMPLAFETTYDDFRTVDGVLVPFLERNWANGRTTGETSLESVSFPQSLPDATFRP